MYESIFKSPTIPPCLVGWNNNDLVVALLTKIDLERMHADSSSKELAGLISRYNASERDRDAIDATMVFLTGRRFCELASKAVTRTDSEAEDLLRRWEGMPSS